MQPPDQDKRKKFCLRISQNPIKNKVFQTKNKTQRPKKGIRKKTHVANYPIEKKEEKPVKKTESLG